MLSALLGPAQNDALLKVIDGLPALFSPNISDSAEKFKSSGLGKANEEQV